MFDIVTIEPEDTAVMMAVNAMTQTGSKAFITVPKEGYRFIACDKDYKVGNGGASDVLVVVGHAGPNTLSNEKTWKGFVSNVSDQITPDWRAGKKKVYLVACSTHADGEKFAYGNIANEIKEQFPDAAVWASDTEVSANDLSGDWTQV